MRLAFCADALFAHNDLTPTAHGSIGSKIEAAEPKALFCLAVAKRPAAGPAPVLSGTCALDARRRCECVRKGAHLTLNVTLAWKRPPHRFGVEGISPTGAQLAYDPGSTRERPAVRSASVFQVTRSGNAGTDNKVDVKQVEKAPATSAGQVAERLACSGKLKTRGSCCERRCSTQCERKPRRLTEQGQIDARGLVAASAAAGCVVVTTTVIARYAFAAAAAIAVVAVAVAARCDAAAGGGNAKWQRVRCGYVAALPTFRRAAMKGLREVGDAQQGVMRD